MDVEPAELLSVEVPDFKKQFKPAKGVTIDEAAVAFSNLTEIIEIETDEVEDDSNQGGDDWRSKPIGDLELEERITVILQAAGLETIGQAFDHGEKNQGFRNINGIGEATQSQIVDALAKFVPMEAGPVAT